MIKLRPMDQEEFVGFANYFLKDYSAEIAKNYGLSEKDATAQATQELQSDLPDGAKTKGQILLCILAGDPGADQHVGYLWYQSNLENGQAFIKDFHILPEHQGKGYGKKTMKTLQLDLEKEGIRQIRLRVAADNERAHYIYRSQGFRTTGINMCKNIGET